MKIVIIFTGKTSDRYFEDVINEYLTRLQKFISTEIVVTREVQVHRGNNEELIKKTEANEILRHIDDSDYVILLDEKGEEYTSIQFAQLLNSYFYKNIRRLVFIVGGAYGFSEDIYQRGNKLLSLSRMTFTHQMVRIFFVEQLYRAFTLMKRIPYHH